ncbi:MAG: glucose-1-phosphate adenylyltransferase, partial [Halioglobus sp.]|nr:glucose-1-phosphate adenylyltransferase [Halioglobus sp.]
HIYKMDYGTMLAAHVESEADITVGCIEVPLDQARSFGVMTVDADHRIQAFAEKPQNPAPTVPGGRHDLASMGIYIFRTQALIEELLRDADTPGSGRDFGGDILPDVIQRRRVTAFPFREDPGGRPAYWRDVGTLDSFWSANLELIGVSPELNLYDRDWPIWTYQEQVPPAKFVFDDDGRRGFAVDSMVAGGCIVSGSSVRHSLLFSSVNVHSYSSIEDSVIFPQVDIGRRCVIRKAIIDRGCIIPPDTSIGVDPQADASRYQLTDSGVVLVTPDMLGQRLHYVR